MNLIFDIETNGLLDTMTVIHCIAVQEVDDLGKPLGEVQTFNSVGSGDGTILHGMTKLSHAECIIGHNIAAFDIPAILKLYPEFTYKSFKDTLLLSTLAYPDLEGLDWGARKRSDSLSTLPGNLIGRHSLEAWGHRLKCWKGDYAKQCKALEIDPWAEWSQEMEDYCKQDVEVTRRLYKNLTKKEIAEEAIQLEHAVAPILARQQRHGFLFDMRAADLLTRQLMERRSQLAAELENAVPPWQEVKRVFTPKRDDKRRGYKKGVETTVYQDVLFNPNSRDHISNRLQTLYGWKPQEYTANGKPKVDEEVLSKLDFPIIPALTEYLVVNKRLGQIAEGKEAWTKAVAKDGRIHGSVHQNAAVTGRMTHSRPNMAQVPRIGNPYGKQCRALFCVPDGKALVGIDASGLELRCLAHYMARYDDGAYVRAILDGDIHSLNQEAAGLSTRDEAKTFIYAFLYGAGDEKLGSIVGKGKRAGTRLRKQFLSGLPALDELVKGVKATAKKRKWLRGLDGRKLHVRSEHSALNTLLQSAGALVMKQALTMLDRRLQECGFIPGREYEFVANIHDEFQLEVDEHEATFVGNLGVDAIRDAGMYFDFRCPLDGEYKVGKNWSQTH